MQERKIVHPGTIKLYFPRKIIANAPARGITNIICGRSKACSNCIYSIKPTIDRTMIISPIQIIFLYFFNRSFIVISFQTRARFPLTLIIAHSLYGRKLSQRIFLFNTNRAVPPRPPCISNTYYSQVLLTNLARLQTIRCCIILCFSYQKIDFLLTFHRQ